MLDRVAYVGHWQGVTVVWYGRLLYASNDDVSYQTFATVPPHTHQVFMHKGLIFFLGYN
jgi:hypothetical protein